MVRITFVLIKYIFSIVFAGVDTMWKILETTELTIFQYQNLHPNNKNNSVNKEFGLFLWKAFYISFDLAGYENSVCG